MKFYCSNCGSELVHTRKAVPGKGFIVDLIEPHECPGYAVKAKEDERSTILDIIESLKPLGKTETISNGKSEEGRHAGPGDLRNDKSDITTTAPRNLLNMLQELPNQEHGDLDEEPD